MSTGRAGVRTPIAVVWIGNEWRLLHSGRRWGRFEYQVDAVEAAIRLARHSNGQGLQAEILVQDRWGALAALDLAG